MIACKKSLTTIVFAIFAVFLILSACNQPVLSIALKNLDFEISKENITIKSGTSFGKCIGYCETELIINGTEVSFKELARGLSGQMLPDRFFTDSIAVDEWNELVGNFDWDTFAALDSVIGCPDCTDGGAEWIEVEYFGRIKKVTFEFGESLDGLDTFVMKIRQIRKNIMDRIHNGSKSPKVILTGQNPDSLQQDKYSLLSATIEKDVLTAEISHSGGCRQHFYTLYMTPKAFKESFPVQADLYLVHRDDNDPCDAILFEARKFDLRPIADLYRDSYGRLDKIILNIFGYYEGTPGNAIQVEYSPE